MSTHHEITFTLDFSRRDAVKPTVLSDPHGEGADSGIPRLARLLALAIRLEGLIREESMRDYAEIARVGRVTRARMTQIMKLLNLAPDIQETILFLPSSSGLNERNLRPISSLLDWDEQRRIFQEIMRHSPPTDELS